VTWHRSDDGFPEHPKCDALAEHFGDDWASLAVAFMAWHHLGCDCAARRTDGAFNRARAYRVLRAPRDVVDRALEALMAVRLLDRTRDGFVFHDWSDYQPTRAELDAERAAKTERQKKWRDSARLRDRVDGAVDGAVDASTRRLRDASVDASVDAAPSRPVPSRPVEETVAPAALLSPAPTAQTTSTRGRARTGARAVITGDGPAFGPAEAFGALASTSGGRFAAGDASTWSAGQIIATRKLIRRHGDLGTWRLVGEWLAAGGDRYRGTVGPSWASSALPDAIARAQHWHAQGRPAIDGRPFALAEPPDPWVAAAARQGVRL
jgi:hypothetical protein